MQEPWNRGNGNLVVEGAGTSKELEWETGSRGNVKFGAEGMVNLKEVESSSIGSGNLGARWRNLGPKKMFPL